MLRRHDGSLAALLGLAALVELLARPGLAHSPAAVALTLALAAPVAVRHRRPLTAFIVFAALRLLSGVVFGSGGDFPPTTIVLAAVLLSATVGAHCRTRDGLAAVVLLAAVLQVAVGFSEFPNFEIVFFTLAPWWAGREAGARRRLVDALAARATELEAAEETFVALSVRRERARIALELHDIVSHHLAVMVIQAGAGRLAGGSPVDAARRRLTTIADSGSQALADLARLLEQLDRAPGSSRGPALDTLLDHARATGVDVRAGPLPPDIRLSREARITVYRVVQEGITNALKHAPGARVTIDFTPHPGALEIQVRDTGDADASRPLAATGSTVGLTGMRERLHALGGTLTAAPDDAGGWRLTARIPTQGAEATPVQSPRMTSGYPPV